MCKISLLLVVVIGGRKLERERERERGVVNNTHTLPHWSTPKVFYTAEFFNFGHLHETVE